MNLRNVISNEGDPQMPATLITMALVYHWGMGEHYTLDLCVGSCKISEILKNVDDGEVKQGAKRTKICVDNELSLVVILVVTRPWKLLVLL